MAIETTPAQTGGHEHGERVPATKEEWAAAVAAFEQAYPQEPIALPVTPMQRRFTTSGIESSVVTVLEAASGKNKHTLHLYGRSLKGCGIHAVRDVLALGKEGITEIRNIGRLAIPPIADIISMQAPNEHWHEQPPMPEITQLYGGLNEVPMGIASTKYAALGLSVEQVATETSHRLAMFVARGDHYRDDQLNAVLRAQCLARDFSQKFYAAQQ